MIFYSSTDFLASHTTITESLYSIRTPINTRPISYTFYSSTNDKNCPADFITRKIETLGSIFSHETESLLAMLTTYTRKSTSYTYSHKYTSNKLYFL